MPGRLAGKRVLITGAAGGIGRATAELFSHEGAQVVGLDHTWPDTSTSFERLAGDVTDMAVVTDAVATASDGVGLDVLIANAGILIISDWLTSPESDWAHLFNINLLGVLRCFKAAARDMLRYGRAGRLLATASMAGLRGDGPVAAYCASKAAVISLVESAALTLAEHRITVNAVAPGDTDTSMLRQGAIDYAREQGLDPAAAAAASLAKIPAGRLATANEIADAFAYLASDSAAYVTGTVLRVDGGLLLT